MAAVKGVVIDIAALMQNPAIIQELLLHTLDLEGLELICRSSLGRSTTRKLLREHLLLRERQCRTGHRWPELPMLLEHS